MPVLIQKAPMMPGLSSKRSMACRASSPRSAARFPRDGIPPRLASPLTRSPTAALWGRGSEFDRSSSNSLRWFVAAGLPPGGVQSVPPVPPGDGRALCDEPKSRSIPFVVYSGYPRPAALDAPFIPKPTNAQALVVAVKGLLERPAT